MVLWASLRLDRQPVLVRSVHFDLGCKNGESAQQIEATVVTHDRYNASQVI